MPPVMPPTLSTMKRTTSMAPRRMYSAKLYGEKIREHRNKFTVGKLSESRNEVRDENLISALTEFTNCELVAVLPDLLAVQLRRVHPAGSHGRGALHRG